MESVSGVEAVMIVIFALVFSLLLLVFLANMFDGVGSVRGSSRRLPSPIKNTKRYKGRERGK